MLSLNSHHALRRGVVTNYISFTLLAVIFCLGEYRSWNVLLGVLALVCLFFAALSFYLTYGQTGFWKLAHTPAPLLDERQIQVTHETFRRSYATFGAVSLALLVIIVFSVRFSVFTLTFRGHYSFGLAVFVYLNYLINILPTSYLAWSEKPVLA